MLPVAITLRQFAEGLDFESPSRILGNITNEKAVLIPPCGPYSIATNVAHAEQWQRSWLRKIQGLAPFDVWKHAKDFPIIEPEDWPQVRQAFLEGVNTALAIAETDPFEHKLKSDDSAIKKLNQIAVHGAYHLGQVKLLKRILYATSRKSPI